MPLLHLIIILLLPLKLPKIPVLFICFILGSETMSKVADSNVAKAAMDHVGVLVCI